MKKFLIPVLLANSLLLASSTDLSCKKIPVSIYYAGYKDINNEQQYVYFNKTHILNVTPPKSISEKKTFEVITTNFTNKATISSDGKNIKFTNTVDDSNKIANRLKNLSQVPISIYYAGYKDSNNEQKYVYYNGTHILDITPPKTVEESKSFKVVTNEFESLPTLALPTDNCTYDVALDKFVDKNFQECTPNTNVSLSFTALVGKNCSDGYIYKAQGVSGDITNNTSIFRVNGITYTLIAYSNINIEQSNASSNQAVVFNGMVLGKSIPNLSISNDYLNNDVVAKLYSGNSVFDETTQIHNTGILSINATAMSLGNMNFTNQNDLSVPMPTDSNLSLLPPSSPTF